MTAPLLRPFPLGAVRIDGASVFARARDELLHLARAYPVDRLLAVFRRNAGLDTRGALPPGNWEDFGHPDEDAWGEHDYPGREHARTANLLRGHYAGHFLSMLALAAAGEGDPALRAKVDELTAGLGEVRDALAATGRYSHYGFLAAYGEWQFSRLEDFAPYGEIWAPYYTCHKLMAGLLDAYELVGNAQALDLANAMGRWVHGRLARLEPERRQRMWSLYIAGEFGGMNETLARLSAVVGEPRFLETAAFFDQDHLLDAGASGADVLTDMHANQHLPQLIGYVDEYELTGERRYLDAAAGLWDQIVPGRVYAHGGTGESELWGPPGVVAGDVGHRNAETCASYNLLKLARRLFAHTRDARYMTYYERTLLNHILGSRRAVRSDTGPEVTYMFPVHPGARREYDNVGTCCGGTGLENHVKYQDTVFYQGPGALYANLPIDAELDWTEPGLRVTQRSGFPLGESITLRFDALHSATSHTASAEGATSPAGEVGAPAAEGGSAPTDCSAPGAARTVLLRKPAWTAKGVTLSLNGEPTGVEAVAGAPAAGAGAALTDPSGLGAERTVHLRVPAWAAGGVTLSLNGKPVGVEAVAGEYASLTRVWEPGDELVLTAPVSLRAEPTIDDPRQCALYLGATLLLARSEATTALAFGLNGRRAFDGSLITGRTGPQLLAELAREGTVELDGTAFEPCWSGEHTRYHMYVLSADAEIAFGGNGTGVPNRQRADGSTFLDELWAPGSFPDRAAFLHRVAAVAARVRAEGLLGRDELATVLTAAAAFDGATGDPRPVAPGDVPPVPAFDGPVPPAVAIEILDQPAPSGWYTTAPRIRLRGFDIDRPDTAADLALELRVSGGDWTPYTRPVAITEEGVHRIEARVTGPDGLTGTVSREISVDTAPPVSRATVKELGASVEITLHADDGVSGVERIQWEGPGTFWGTFQEAFVRAIGDEPQVIEYAATDRAGNEEPRRRLVLPGKRDRA
ncbi:beta-L-arabinofuranosidase domain-containing protein [Glycomyces terrestris]|uniref:Glycosyl hydrolase n=1 Tax=Glycomyces terrestris TaxID=2493553 RepID=A0A426UT64_9ACTN|nr:beta-L-arabinofuranosidase domain-containing protein [Glycomyces terrestris]RRR96843.1 glycosyl hydrolase [Glycomyces terrestris]